jgi:hypothetical protein
MEFYSTTWKNETMWFEGKTGPVWGLIPVGRGRILGKCEGAECSGDSLYSCRKIRK